MSDYVAKIVVDTYDAHEPIGRKDVEPYAKCECDYKECLSRFPAWDFAMYPFALYVRKNRD
jgi:hypothetical protein